MVAKKLNLHLGGYTQVCRPAVRSFVRVVKRRVASHPFVAFCISPTANSSSEKEEIFQSSRMTTDSRASCACLL